MNETNLPIYQVVPQFGLGVALDLVPAAGLVDHDVVTVTAAAAVAGGGNITQTLFHISSFS